MIEYKLLVFDRNTWNLTSEHKVFVLDRNTWNHTTVYKLFVFDRNTWYHLTAYKNLLWNNNTKIVNLNVSKVKLATIVEGDPKAPFSIATTPRCTGER